MIVPRLAGCESRLPPYSYLETNKKPISEIGFLLYIVSMDKRLLKQILIASIFVLIIAVPVYFGFFSGEPEATSAPTPAIFEPAILLEKLFKVNDLDYDFLVQIRNPNAGFGAAELTYELRLFGAAGQVVFEQAGSTFLLPGQTRYEIISPIRPDAEAVGFDFRVVGADWQRVDDFVLPSLLSVRGPGYSEVQPPEQGFSEITGSVFNDSSFDFETVDVYGVLFDGRNEPIAVSRTDIRTFLSKTDRSFEVKWFSPFDGEVARFEVVPYINVLRNQNFIKEHGIQERFQEFY